MNKWLKRLGLTVAVLLALVATIATWLLESESGARFALARVKAALADKISIEQAHGVLASPLELDGLRYRDPAAGTDISIKSIKVEYALSGLFSKTLHVHNVEIDGVDVVLHPVAPTPISAPPPTLQSLLTPPLAILLDGGHVSKIAIAQDAKPVFAADSIDLAAAWTNTALTVQRLAVRAPDGRVDLTGALDSYADYRGHAQFDFDWRVGQQRVAGGLTVNNNSKLTTLALNLNQPAKATANATLVATTDILPWTLSLDVPSFDPAKITQNDAPTASGLKTIALKLQGSGGRTHGMLTGNIDLDAHRVLLDPLQFALAGQTLTLQSLRLRSPDVSGTLTANGKLQLDARPVGGELTLNWSDVELPGDLVGQVLATHGGLHIGGSVDTFDAQGEFSIGPPGKLADIGFKLDGTPQKISLRQFDLKQAKGGLNASGEIDLQPQIGWNLEATANHLDPGAFAAAWPGAMDFALSTNGKVDKIGPSGKLKLDRLGGTLRQRALSGNAELTFASPFALDGTLNLASGNSSLALRGKSGPQTDVDVDLAVASLGDWVPQAGGDLHGSIALQGTWPKLDMRGKLHASKIAYSDIRADALTFDIDVHDLSAPSGRLDLDAKAFSASGYAFDTLSFGAHGSQSAHSLALHAHGSQLGIDLALDGALMRPDRGNADWQGSLSALSLTAKDQPAWTLTKPAALAYLNGDFSLGELCLSSGKPDLCLAATQAAVGVTQARFSIHRLPLAALAHFANPDTSLRVEGEIDGTGNIARGADGALDGSAKIVSDAGSIVYPDHATQPLIGYRNFHVDANLSHQTSAIDIHGDLDNDGRLDGHIAIGATSSAGMALSGNVSANLHNLGFVDLLTDQTSATQGKLDAKFALSGTSGAPGIAGELALTQFTTEIPAAGLKLRDGNVSLKSDDGRSFAIQGGIGSSDGKLALSGNVGVAGDAPIALKITGDNFLAADIPGAQVRVSPDLTLARNAGKYTLTGTVTIPKADVDLSKLPSGGAAKSSPDVVVTDEQNATAATNMPFDADITLKLGAGEKLDMDLRQGQEVHLLGFGLNGFLSGQLAVQDRTGRPTSGRGQILVNGTYKAYGQDLTIEQGRLLFASTPIDNPGLDIRATRGFTDPDVTVGLQVRGTAQVPALTVFSDPAMEQSDALSYLVAGKPMSQLKSGEGDAVGSAARALGTAGGDLLAKSIGNKMGLDDVGVADNSAVGGAALTVGKYLSPRLYLSYGVGLFTPGEVVTLRYRLTRLFNIEMQNGTLSSRAGINYKIEK